MNPASARKIVPHPGVFRTPEITIMEALGVAMNGEMQDCIVIFTDTNGEMHISWSKQSGADLAAAALILEKVALAELTK